MFYILCFYEQTYNSDKFAELFIGLTLASFCLLVGLIYCLTRYCRYRLIVSDAAKLSQIAPRHCVVLQRHGQLRVFIKKLCKQRWRGGGMHRLNVINVAIIVNNDFMKQRYEQTYQALQQMAPQIVSSSLVVNPLTGSRETSFMVTGARFAHGVLRPGERYMMYLVDKDRINAILSSSALPFYVLNVGVGSQAIMHLNPDHLSSHLSISLRTKNRYLFVVRVTTDASGSTNPFITNANITSFLPEFLVSYRLEAR